MLTRRQFSKGVATLAFAGLVKSHLGYARDPRMTSIAELYGPLKKDPGNLLDLPEGFTYTVISQLGDQMADGLQVPDRADGMGCIQLDNYRLVLVRNHELHPEHLGQQPDSIQTHRSSLAYDRYSNGIALPGGTSNIIYNQQTKQVEKQFLSLTGTSRNCAGGITPWGTWLTCEENVDRANGKVQKDHGYVFEVPANVDNLIEAKPIKSMGRFNHEAAAVDPETGIVYMTEDRGDSLLYRFVPNEYGKLAKGGKLQALVIDSLAKFDTRNWSSQEMNLQQWLGTSWIDIENPESPEDDLRKQGYDKGAALFARGEGVYWGENELYFCCTNGGKKQLGQIMRYQPSAQRIQLFLESEDESLFNFGDNLTVAPDGHLIVCEDQYSEVVDNHLRGVTPEGEVYTFAKLTAQTELAGACFSPDGKILFVNVYSPTKTLAITGPFHHLEIKKA